MLNGGVKSVKVLQEILIYVASSVSRKSKNTIFCIRFPVEGLHHTNAIHTIAQLPV